MKPTLNKLILAVTLFVTQIAVGYSIYKLGYFFFGPGSKTGLFWGLTEWFAYYLLLLESAINALSIVFLKKLSWKLIITAGLFIFFAINLTEFTYHPYKSLLIVTSALGGLLSAYIVNYLLASRLNK